MLSTLRSIRHWHRYREIVSIFFRHGFGFAFDQLEPELHSLRRVLRLPARKKLFTPPEDLALHFRMSLEELGLTFIKFGQILSTRPDLLPPIYISELSKLRDTVPPVPWEMIREVLIQELGREPEHVFTTIDPQSIAAASLAQVHTATLPDGHEVVVKVQRPGITSVIDTDLKILSTLAVRAQAIRSWKRYMTLSAWQMTSPSPCKMNWIIAVKVVMLTVFVRILPTSLIYTFHTSTGISVANACWCWSVSMASGLTISQLWKPLVTIAIR